MPKTDSKEAPKGLRGYIFHGVDLSYSGTADAIAECPFCNREQKFFVSQEKGLYSCKVCGEQGNLLTFIRTLHKESLVDASHIELVAEERKIGAETLLKWGLCRSEINEEWILPAYTPNSKKEIVMTNLYRWSKAGKEGKRRLLSTATLNHAIFGLQFWEENKGVIYVCEGPWDAMCLDCEISKTELAEDSIIVGLPGCETNLADDWLYLFKGKTVVILFDSDAPKETAKGKVIPSAGYTGMRRVARQVKSVAYHIEYIHWGPKGYDPNRESGFDIRDLLTSPIHDNDNS